MTDLELAEEIERYLSPDAIYYQWLPSMADMEQIIAALRQADLAQTEIKGHMRVVDDLRAGYSKGYYAGASKRWPDYKPPNPPDENCAGLFLAAKDLADAAHEVCACVICDTEPFIELQKRVCAVDEQFKRISEWLKGK